MAPADESAMDVEMPTVPTAAVAWRMPNLAHAEAMLRHSYAEELAFMTGAVLPRFPAAVLPGRDPEEVRAEQQLENELVFDVCRALDERVERESLVRCTVLVTASEKHKNAVRHAINTKMRRHRYVWEHPATALAGVEMVVVAVWEFVPGPLVPPPAPAVGMVGPPSMSTYEKREITFTFYQ